MNMNQLYLAGNLTKDAEVIFTPKGQKKTVFRLASNRKYRTKAGEVKEDHVFMTVVAWDKLGESVANLKKGENVLVIGRLHQREFEKDGVKNTIVEVAANEIKFLSPKIEQVNKELDAAPSTEE